MIKIILLILSLLMPCTIAAGTKKARSIKVFATSNEPEGLFFQALEHVSNTTGFSIGLEFTSSQRLLESLAEGKQIDILITPSYELLAELKEQGLVNFAYVEEMFFDRLVTVAINSDEDAPGGAIFFKTNPNDRDVFINKEPVPSITLEGAKLCRKAEMLAKLYQGSYKHFILKESLAKKCELRRTAYFDNLYDVYYIALISRENGDAAKAMKLISGSGKVKNMIKSNGYNY